MDQRLVAWARAVKARRRRFGARVPVLWLLTDAARMPDPLPAIRALPRGLCGVVFRHDGVPHRAALGAAVAALCRSRGLPLTVAGDGRLAAELGAGVHVRRGVPDYRRRRSHGLVTASAHGVAELLRAARLGADAVFVSPVLPTPSHPERAGLGVPRFAALCRLHRAVLALGGIDGASARRLPRRHCAGAGAIGALEARA